MASFYEDLLIRIHARDDSEQTFSGLKGKFAALKVVVGAAVTSMGSQLLQFTETCVSSAIQAEGSWNAYNSALERAGMKTTEQTKEMKSKLLDLANTLGRSTGDVRQAATDFMNYGASVEDSMKGAAAVSALAAAKNTDYASSENIIMSALKGRGGQLKSLGLNIDDYKDKTTGAIDTTKLFADITEKYGNNQAKYSKSAAAQQERWNNSLAAFKTSVGQALLPILEAVTPLITDIAKAMSNPVIAAFVGVLAGIIGGLSLLAGPLMAINGLLELFGVEVTLSLGPVGLAIIAIVAVGTALYIAYKKVKWFRDGVNQLGRTLKQIGEKVYTFFSNIAHWLGTLGLSGNMLFGGTVKTQTVNKGGGAGGKDAGTTYTGQQQTVSRLGLLNTGLTQRPVQTNVLATGNPNYSQKGALTTGNPTYNRNTNTQTQNMVLQEGALQVDARNLTTHEAKQVIIGAFESITSKGTTNATTTGGNVQNG